MKKQPNTVMKILVIDDHNMVRKGMCGLLDKQPDMEVIGEAGEGRTAVQLALKLSPDIVIMDVAMPDLNGIVATHKIIVKRPGTKVIALSMYSDENYISGMLKAGASGYLLKECPFEDLIRAIHTVIENKVFLSPDIVDIMSRDYVRRLPEDEASVSSDFSTLSDREREVLQLITEGKNTKEIASSLHVSIKTIDSHRKNIMNKLNIHSIAELTKYAIREKITSL